MKYPLHIIIRRKFSSGISKLFSLLSANKHKVQTYLNYDKDSLRSIVIIRPNYRIGNLLFLTPLINELTQHFPNVTIDIVVGNKNAAMPLAGMPTVNSIIDIPRKLLKHPLQLIRYIRTTRKKEYDVAINISSGSLSSQIVLSFINAKYKIGFRGEKTWAKYTHLQNREPHFKHMGLEPLDFLTFFNLPYPKKVPTLDIKLTEEEIARAKNDFLTLLQSNNIKNKNVITIFRGARFDKKIDDKWWNMLHNELIKNDNDTVIVEILSPDIPTSLNDKVLTYSNKNLRVLGAFLRLSNCFISGDTGPMHLAVASGARVVALFKFDNSDTYGALGESNETINIHTTDVQQVSKIITEKYL